MIGASVLIGGAGSTRWGPAPRREQAKTPSHLLELACALRVEDAARTAAQIQRLIVEAEGWAPTARTLQRHLQRAGLPWRGVTPSGALGRFEADRPNELWTGDALHGPSIAGRKGSSVLYHRREHSETGQTPLDRFLAPGPPVLRSDAVLREASLWSERRTVSKTGTFGMHSNDSHPGNPAIPRRAPHRPQTLRLDSLRRIDHRQSQPL